MQSIFVQDISSFAKQLLREVEKGLKNSYDNPDFSTTYNPYIPAQHSARLILKMFHKSDINLESDFRQAYTIASKLPSFRSLHYGDDWESFLLIIAEQLQKPIISPMSICSYTLQSGLNQFVKYGQMNQSAIQHLEHSPA